MNNAQDCIRKPKIEIHPKYNKGETYMCYIFLQDEYNGDVLVGKEDWFKTMPLCQTYDDYGQKVGCDDDQDCSCLQVRSYNYWDGSNFKSAITSDDDISSRYNEITNQEEIDYYVEALENKEFEGETTGVKTYRFENLIIRKSIWLGSWELFSIHEDNN